MHDAHVEMLMRPGNRRLAVHRLAEGGAGRSVVFCHAAPGAGNFDPNPEQTAARAVTLLATDRPGYGQSDPLATTEWPSIVGAADDLAALIDQRGERPVGVAGWSAGGRVALALAARRPELVDRVVVLATPAPQEEVPWVPEEQQAGLEALRGLPPEEAQAALQAQLAPAMPKDAADPSALRMLAVSDADEAALALPGARERLGLMLSAAAAQGAAGVAADIISYGLRPWGFEPDAVRAKTLLLYGSADPVAGPRHGRWWQKRLPQARLEVVPGAGHLLVLTMWERALAHLAPGTKRR
jgi:pimeloyl-ACP methyl ester carboxylesterase